MNERHLRAWFVVFVVAIFLAGIGAGLILDRYVGPRPLPRADLATAGRLGPRGGGAGFGPAVVTRRLANQLNLTADQQKKIDDIFARRRQRLQEIRSEVRARFESEQRDLRDEISKVLTPDQQKRFEQWLAESGPGMRRGGGPGFGRGGAGRSEGPGREGRF